MKGIDRPPKYIYIFFFVHTMEVNDNQNLYFLLCSAFSRTGLE